MQQHYIQKSTIDLVPLEKVGLHLHEMRVGSSIHAAPRQHIPDFQPNLFDQIDFDPISSIVDCTP
jgi:hypothetical protein